MMTPTGRVALVLGLVFVATAFVAGTVEVRAGQHDCGSAVSAHTPPGSFAGSATAGAAEDQCDHKIKVRRFLVGVLGIGGLIVALAGAYQHEPDARDS
jgi:hypothetical protein